METETNINTRESDNMCLSAGVWFTDTEAEYKKKTIYIYIYLMKKQ